MINLVDLLGFDLVSPNKEKELWFKLSNEFIILLTRTWQNDKDMARRLRFLKKFH